MRRTRSAYEPGRSPASRNVPASVVNRSPPAAGAATTLCGSGSPAFAPTTVPAISPAGTAAGAPCAAARVAAAGQSAAAPNAAARRRARGTARRMNR